MFESISLFSSSPPIYIWNSWVFSSSWQAIIKINIYVQYSEGAENLTSSHSDTLTAAWLAGMGDWGRGTDFCRYQHGGRFVLSLQMIPVVSIASSITAVITIHAV